MDNIMLHYWPSWAKKSRKSAPIWQRRKCFFIKIMHAYTPVLWQWQNDTNWSSNCIRIRICITHRIRQIQPPVTFSCFKTWKNGLPERDLNQTRMSSAKQRPIFKNFQNLTFQTAWKKIRKSLGEVYRATRRLCWKIKMRQPEIMRYFVFL